MRTSDPKRDQEAETASREAIKGALYGAVKWGAVTALLGGLGYAMSPLYRGLTIQFKVYLQMSGTVTGGMIEADRRVREFEAQMRVQRRLMRDRAAWQAFEKEYGKDEGDD